MEIQGDELGDGTRRAGFGLLVVGCLLAIATLWIFRDDFVDDAYISLRYARNLLAGHGLVWNPGEYVEGITNLGHVLVVAGLGWLGLDLTLAARCVGIAGGLAAVVYGPAALLPDRADHLERSIARLLLLANFSFVYMAVTGLETIFYVGLLCLACFAFERADRRIDWHVGLLIGLLFMVRPDGGLMGAVLVGLAIARAGIGAVLRMPGVWVFGLVIASVELFRWTYYGALVPNTALVKGLGAVSDLPWYGEVGDDVVEMLAQTGGATSLLFAVVALFFHRRREAVQIAVAICAAGLLFDVYAGGDWMLCYRFLLPILPFYLSLVAIGVTSCARALVRARPDQSRLLLGAGWLGLLVVAVNCWSFGLAFLQNRDAYPNSHMTSTHMREAAQWLAGRYPAGLELRVGSIGAVGYFTDLVIVDPLGLTDRAIAQAGRDRAARNAYLHARNPDLVMVFGATAEPVDRVPEFHGRRYEYVRSFPLGEQNWWLYARQEVP